MEDDVRHTCPLNHGDVTSHIGNHSRCYPKWLRFDLVFVHVIDELTDSAQADRRYAHTLFSLKDRSLNMIQAGGECCALTRHVARRPEEDQV